MHSGSYRCRSFLPANRNLVDREVRSGVKGREMCSLAELVNQIKILSRRYNNSSEIRTL